MSSGDVQSAPDAARPAEFEPCGDALGVADAPPQTTRATAARGRPPRAGGARSLTADFGGSAVNQYQKDARQGCKGLGVD
eukprot:594268-Pyramimonas_sp.AAC.1